MRTIRVGNGCGFWGDNLDAPVQLAERGQLDYLTLEYLAELTLSIMAHQRRRDPNAGYAADFIDQLRRVAPFMAQQPRLKIITNAGGMNPAACAAAARKVLDESGLTVCRIAVVSGDDLLDQLPELIKAGHAFNHIDTGEPLAPLLDRVVSANAYLGAAPIVDSLAQGARVVITGRVADASLTVAPAIHQFAWQATDWQRIAGATVAGHLIECGAQVTGGLYCNWWSVPDYANIGYPIAVINEDGGFEITKPPATGGLVNRETVIEQLLYEIGDPTDYLTPDIRADFTSLSIENTSEGVRVLGAKGKPATSSYKVSIAYRDGFMASGILAVYVSESVERDYPAWAKAGTCGRLVLKRLERANCRPEQAEIEVLGDRDHQSRSPVAFRVAVRDLDSSVVGRFCRELAPLVTSGLPGVTGYTDSRPHPREVLAYWPAIVSREVVHPKVEIL